MLTNKSDRIIIKPKRFLERIWRPFKDLIYDPFDELFEFGPGIEYVKNNSKEKDKDVKWIDLLGNFQDSEDSYQFSSGIPEGFEKSDVKVAIKERGGSKILDIYGEKKDEKNQRHFEKKILLNDPIQIDNIKAKINEKNELLINIPKVKQEVKNIQIE